MNKKIIYFCMVLVMVFVCTCSNFVVAASIPRLAIGAPSSGTVEVGGTIRYNVNIYNNATSVTLNASHIRLGGGVSANISVEGSGNAQRTIVLSNIQGSVGATGYISYIAGGVASNEKGGSREMNITSSSFTIVATQNNNPAPNPQPGNDNNNNNNWNNNNNYLPPNTNNTENNNDNPNNEDPEEKKDETAPTMEIGELSEKVTQIGKEISFEISYKDETEMGEITLNNNDITLYGFKADINISGDGNSRKVTLSNIQGNLGGLKWIEIADKTAKDKAGNLVKEKGKTSTFKVVNSDTKNKSDDWIENPNTGKRR